MAKDDRLYAKFTLDFPDHPKILCLSAAAKWALVELTIYSRRHMTDGFVGKAVAIAKHGADVCLELATNDPASPSLIEVENGYQIHDFEAHQSTRAEIESLTEKRKEAGRKGGEARAKQVLKQTGSKSKPETETETYNPPSPQGGDSASGSHGERFEEFWNAYPKKVAKKPAEAKYKIACRKSSPDHLLEALGAQKRTYREKHPTGWDFFPNATTWLNQERWTDDDAPKRQTAEQIIDNALETGDISELNPLAPERFIVYWDDYHLEKRRPEEERRQFVDQAKRDWINKHRAVLVDRLKSA